MSERASEPDIWAAGGVVEDESGRLLVVHRPRYDDWTFPKGKLDKGETLEQCALREVEEESGCICDLGDPLVAIRYVDHKGRAKEVRYWRMTVVEQDFRPNDEVDEIRWVKPKKAAGLLSYTRDLEVLQAALA